MRHVRECVIVRTAFFRNASPSWIAPWSSPESGKPHVGLPMSAAVDAEIPCMSLHWSGLIQTKFGTCRERRSAAKRLNLNGTMLASRALPG